MTSKRLNSSQTLCLRFIESYIRDNGYSPTVREIQSHLGHRSTSSAANILDVLRAAGYLTSEPKIARSIRLLVEKERAA